MLAAAALAACAAMADGEISSENIVGYNTVTIRPGWNMFAVNFKDPSNENGIAIQDLFPGEAMVNKGAIGGADASSGDSIQVYDPTNSSNPYAGTYVLFYTTKAALSTRNYKWVKGTAPTDVKFKNGQAFWYKSKATETYEVAISGEVELSSSKDVTIIPGWNMIASPFAANFNPNALGTEYWKAKIDAGEAMGGSDASNADSIQIYDASNSQNPYANTYVLFYTTKAALSTRNSKWVKGTTPLDAAADCLVPGQGTWYKCKGAGFTLTIPRPYSL